MSPGKSALRMNANFSYIGYLSFPFFHRSPVPLSVSFSPSFDFFCYSIFSNCFSRFDNHKTINVYSNMMIERECCTTLTPSVQ